MKIHFVSQLLKLEGVTDYEQRGRLGCIIVGGDILLPWLPCAELKSLEWRDLQDDLEHQSYHDGSMF